MNNTAELQHETPEIEKRPAETTTVPVVNPDDIKDVRGTLATLVQAPAESDKSRAKRETAARKLGLSPDTPWDIINKKKGELQSAKDLARNAQQGEAAHQALLKSLGLPPNAEYGEVAVALMRQEEAETRKRREEETARQKAQEAFEKEEELRQKNALKYGLPSYATWDMIGQKRRQKSAREYGLPDNATWDMIHEAKMKNGEE